MTKDEWRLLMTEGDPAMATALRRHLVNVIPEIVERELPADGVTWMSSTELAAYLWPMSEREKADQKRVIILFAQMRSLVTWDGPLSRWCYEHWMAAGHKNVERRYEWFNPGPMGQELDFHPANRPVRLARLLRKIEPWDADYAEAQRAAIEQDRIAAHILVRTPYTGPKQEVW